jgi:RES domain-containing protein
LWRIYQAAHGPGLDGSGGLFASGRWSELGHRVVYFSDTPSLAVLEKLVHLDPDFIGENYLLGAFEVDVRIAVVEDLMELHVNWISDLAATAACGARWLVHGSGGLLSVPSAIVPEQRNFLLNPRHREAMQLRPAHERSFQFDIRLFD